MNEIEQRLQQIAERQRLLAQSGNTLEHDKVAVEKQHLITLKRNAEDRAWKHRFNAPIVALANQIVAAMERKTQEKAEQERQEAAALLKQTAALRMKVLIRNLKPIGWKSNGI